ncbi:hypothetical protein Scep_009476 [Stephania cephalantha]|uniref:Terpene synthase N-terminal domain-containing protein n=1 Tax=Stephania cephalantha TaxID=152367 RepID=A0AAP0PG95_9MAGN
MLHSKPTTLLFSLEGMPDLDWEKLLKLQHPNGSFLCSPASTAYALEHTKDKKCLKYLENIVKGFNGGDAFKHFERGGEFFCFVGQSSQGVTEMLSLYRASQVLFPGEKTLREAREFTYKFLKTKLASGQMADRWIITKDLGVEVQCYLEVPFHASLPRIETRYYIDQYGGDDDVWIGKVLYRWYKDCNLKESGLSNVELLKANFVTMSSIFEPERATERLAWTRTMALIEAVTFCFYDEVKTPEQRSSFLASFRTNTLYERPRAMNIKHRLVKAILKTLQIISTEVQRAHGKEDSRKEDCNGEVGIRLNKTIESQMQELLKCVVQSNEGLESNVKQAFIAVAKSFYYTTFIETETMILHIDKMTMILRILAVYF